MLLLGDIKLRIGEKEKTLPQKALRHLKLDARVFEVSDCQIVHKALDARDKQNIRRVYSLKLHLVRHDGRPFDENKFAAVATKKGLTVSVYHAADYRIPLRPCSGEHRRPVVVGFGPCGIFAAYVLASAGLQPIVIERGKPMDKRVRDVSRFWRFGRLDEDSNVLFGEGGAGTFSDGKLTTGTNDPRKHFVLKTLADAGGGDELTYLSKPHIGTDVLRCVVVNLRREIERLGGEVRFGCRLSDILLDADGTLFGIGVTKSGVPPDVQTGELLAHENQTDEIRTDRLILAMGHSARDTYALLKSHGFLLEQKQFSMGVRIEHAQHLIDAAQYGTNFETIYGRTYAEAGLPPAEYKLSHKCEDGRGVYTFCMCPGGTVAAAASEQGCVFSNGMSDRARDSGNANSAVLVDVRTSDFGSDDPLAGILFQQKYERAAFELVRSTQSAHSPEQISVRENAYRLPTETIREFYGNDSMLGRCLPAFVVRGLREAFPVFGRKITGFDDETAMLFGPETRSSSPVRVLRREDMQSNIRGVYPCGEGAGYAGGIMSAAVDGIKAAEAVIAESAIDERKRIHV
ncbi:MAG: NAD(FAD)-utilizing dehydrogenase [Clostridiales Family XIII bacterium]|jgi:uncharacterized FAD-dependent dehydrogenase|nr:NAD(FAD)-utilizing dehydrogenase [Clostridiales Family XIII bacterium]